MHAFPPLRSRGLDGPHGFFRGVDPHGTRWSLDTLAALGRAAGFLLAEPSETLAAAPSAAHPDSVGASAATPRVVRAKQVHGDRVLHAREAGLVGEADAVWTDTPGLFVAVLTADCVPILLAGPGRVAAVHAGWRGLACGILARAVEALGGGAGLRAAVGPCIGAARYEVGDEVLRGIAQRTPEAVFVRRDLGARPHVDLAAAAAWQLREAGVGDCEVIARCTFEHAEMHSFRRDGAAAGRQAALIALPAR